MQTVEALRRTQLAYPRLSRSERAVADLIRTRPTEVALLSLQALAQQCGTSEASVLRFCRSIGYSGYQDFKSGLVVDLLKHQPPAASTDGHGEIGGADIWTNVQTHATRGLEQTIARLDRQLVEELASRILASRRVAVLGVSGSAGVATVFAFGLLACGIEAIHPVDRVEIERLCSLLSPEVVVIGISHSGNAPEVVTGLARAVQAGCFNVAVTHFELSPVARAADRLILTCGQEPLLGSNACTPRALQLIALEVVLEHVAHGLKDVQNRSV